MMNLLLVGPSEQTQQGADAAAAAAAGPYPKGLT